MNRVHKLFKQKKSEILSVFFTAGYPTLDSTTKIAKSLEDAGVDMIEIGIPFSDPIADGPVIQQSNKRALENGMNLNLLLKQVHEIRKSTNIPIILMGYLNPVLQYGVGKFIKDLSEAGVDGLILPDLPIDEYKENFKNQVETNNLTCSFLIAPTTSEGRMKEIDQLSSGFIYAVSSTSTTGVQKSFNHVQEEYFNKVKSLNLNNPFMVGFGVSNKETFKVATRYGAGAIIGSAFIGLLSKSGNLEVDIKRFIKSIKGIE
ncbi:MAG: tryptophan synthase subunit alpha [Flammeovirgaceae bacterium]|nr:tryptophan synthase subunit alpha [Flammeovirgaceae bacterium]